MTEPALPNELSELDTRVYLALLTAGKTDLARQFYDAAKARTIPGEKA